MEKRGVLVEFYDVPEDRSFTKWIYESRYPEVFKLYPGIHTIKRYELVDRTLPGRQQIIMVMESDDIEALRDYRRDGTGLTMKNDADARGVHNRLEHWGRLIYIGHKRQDGTLETEICDRLMPD